MAAISLSYLTSAVNARALLRFLLSSRFLRLRYRLLSLITIFARRTAATVALGALLVLPVVYFAEVL